MSNEQFREHLRKDLRELRHPRGRPRPCGLAARADLLHLWRLQGPGLLRAAWRARSRWPRRIKNDAAATYLYYLATPPNFFADIVEALGEADDGEEPGQLAAGDHREAVRHDLESAELLNQRDPRGPRREADLPHRSLPRQGDGAEHHGLPLRQRHLRADLEPPLHRSRADHRRRERGRRGSRRLLRSAGALRDMVPNHVFQLLAFVAMEPPISFAADAVRDEQVKVLKAIPAHDAPRTCCATPSAASTAKGVIDGERSRPTARRPTSRRTRRPRPSSRSR